MSTTTTISTESITKMDLAGINSANLWNKVSGKERVYLDTSKQNGGRMWNGGKGYSQCYIDLNSNTLIARGCAGAATRDYLAPSFAALAEEFDLTLDVPA